MNLIQTLPRFWTSFLVLAGVISVRWLFGDYWSEGVIWIVLVVAVGALTAMGIHLYGDYQAFRHHYQHLHRRDRGQRLAVPRPQPPAVAEWIIALIVPRRRSEGLLGDLEEHFYRDCLERGAARAQRLYWARALNSIGPLLWSTLKRLGVFAAFAAVLRRYMS